MWRQNISSDSYAFGKWNNGNSIVNTFSLANWLCSKDFSGELSPVTALFISILFAGVLYIIPSKDDDGFFFIIDWYCWFTGCDVSLLAISVRGKCLCYAVQRRCLIYSQINYLHSVQSINHMQQIYSFWFYLFNHFFLFSNLTQSF